jgi:hypothetical protein
MEKGFSLSDFPFSILPEGASPGQKGVSTLEKGFSMTDFPFSLLDFPFSMTDLVISLLDKGISKGDFCSLSTIYVISPMARG